MMCSYSFIEDLYCSLTWVSVFVVEMYSKCKVSVDFGTIHLINLSLGFLIHKIMNLSWIFLPGQAS